MVTQHRGSSIYVGNVLNSSGLIKSFYSNGGDCPHRGGVTHLLHAIGCVRPSGSKAGRVYCRQGVGHMAHGALVFTKVLLLKTLTEQLYSTLYLCFKYFTIP